MTFTGLGNNISGYLNSTNNKNTQSSEINNFLTTYMIDKNGNVFGYVTEALSKDMMKNIINQTLEEKIKIIKKRVIEYGRYLFFRYRRFYAST